MIDITAKPFDWNDNLSKEALEDFEGIRKDLPYCTCQSIGMALAKLELLEKQGRKLKTGHWMRKTKVDGVYDIAGVKTWGVKCQCDKCDFTTTVIEDFGYYNYCPNCGAWMFEPQEGGDQE